MSRCQCEVCLFRGKPFPSSEQTECYDWVDVGLVLVPYMQLCAAHIATCSRCSSPASMGAFWTAYSRHPGSVDPSPKDLGGLGVCASRLSASHVLAPSSHVPQKFSATGMPWLLEARGPSRTLERACSGTSAADLLHVSVTQTALRHILVLPTCQCHSTSAVSTNDVAMRVQWKEHSQLWLVCHPMSDNTALF